MNWFLRVVAVTVGVILGTVYSLRPPMHLSVVDNVLEWGTDVYARHVYSGVASNSDLIMNVAARLGMGQRSEKLRILVLSVPEEAIWDDGTDAANLQLLRFADTIPVWSYKDVYTPSSFKVSESYGAFLATLDPDKANHSPEWGAYRAAERNLLKQFAGPLSSRELSSSVRELSKKRPHAASDIANALSGYSDDSNWLNGDPVYAISDGLSAWSKDTSGVATSLYRAPAEVIAGSIPTDSSNSVSTLAKADVEVGALRVKAFLIEPGKWFTREVLTSHKDGAWIDGAPSWATSKFFGSGGILPLLPRAVIVGQRPTTVLHMLSDDYRRVTNSLQSNDGIQIGGAKFSAADVLLRDDSGHTITFRQNDKRVYIIAIIAEVLP
jgi:hypothetical protein